jgi:NAD(P)-dependent dehydrogenase (short-subunit alcohol dehydrogenase family)
MIESLFSMQDKICVVTGGSRGLGSYMAQGFLEAGAKRVYITARKRDARLASAMPVSAPRKNSASTGNALPSPAMSRPLKACRILFPS